MRLHYVMMSCPFYCNAIHLVTSFTAGKLRRFVSKPNVNTRGRFIGSLFWFFVFLTFYRHAITTKAVKIKSCNDNMRVVKP